MIVGSMKIPRFNRREENHDIQKRKRLLTIFCKRNGRLLYYHTLNLLTHGNYMKIFDFYCRESENQLITIIIIMITS